jgi:hypothetical protein
MFSVGVVDLSTRTGNRQFSATSEKRKRVYLTARFKREKRLIAVVTIRDLNPPGRSPATLGRPLARHCLRKHAIRQTRRYVKCPTIRAEIETEINEQRADMQRAEEEEVARATALQPHPYTTLVGDTIHSYWLTVTHAPPPPPPPHGHILRILGIPGYHNGPAGPPHAQWEDHHRRTQDTIHTTSSPQAKPLLRMLLI